MVGDNGLQLPEEVRWVLDYVDVQTLVSVARKMANLAIRHNLSPSVWSHGGGVAKEQQVEDVYYELVEQLREYPVRWRNRLALATRAAGTVAPHSLALYWLNDYKDRNRTFKGGDPFKAFYKQLSKGLSIAARRGEGDLRYYADREGARFRFGAGSEVRRRPRDSAECNPAHWPSPVALVPVLLPVRRANSVVLAGHYWRHLTDELGDGLAEVYDLADYLRAHYACLNGETVSLEGAFTPALVTAVSEPLIPPGSREIELARTMIADWSAAQCQVFNGWYHDECSLDDLADELCLKLEAVKELLHGAHSSLERMLAAQPRAGAGHGVSDRPGLPVTVAALCQACREQARDRSTGLGPGAGGNHER